MCPAGQFSVNFSWNNNKNEDNSPKTIMIKMNKTVRTWPTVSAYFRPYFAFVNVFVSQLWLILWRGYTTEVYWDYKLFKGPSYSLFQWLILGETIKLSSERKQHYSFILKLLLKKSIQLTWLCSRADIYSMKPPSASITTSIRIRNWEHAFSTSAGGSTVDTRWMAVIRLALVLWEVMLVMFSTYDQTK